MIWPLAPVESEHLLSTIRAELLLPSVLLFGIEAGAVTSGSAVEVELFRLMQGVTMTDTEEAVATSLHRDSAEVVDLLAQAVKDVEPQQVSVQRLWTYVGIVQIRHTASDPVELKTLVNSLILNLGDVREYREFVSFRPMKEFRQRYGRVDFLSALDARLEADRLFFGPGATSPSQPD